MTAVKPAAPYRSGMCVHDRHDRCRGDFGTAVCDCTCHSEPEEAEPEQEVKETAAVLLDVPLPLQFEDLVTLHHGDCLDVLREMPDASVDAIVTDPPYGLEFMGKEWDSFRKDETRCATPPGTASTKNATTALTARNAPSGKASDAPSAGANGEPDPARAASATIVQPDSVGGFQDGNGGNAYSRSRVRTNTQRHGGDAAIANQRFQHWCEQWTVECLRILKPGGYLLAFGGSRTWHRLATAVEDAGFEVRDSIAWLYASGFPKSLNVGRDQRFCQCEPVPYDHAPAPEHHLPRVFDADVPAAGRADARAGAVLLPSMSESGAPADWAVPAAGRSGQSERVVEGRGDAQAPARELHGGALRPVPAGVRRDGAGGRLRDGAPTGNGSVDRPTTDPLGVREPHQPPAGGQPAREPGPLADERRAQDGRGRPLCVGCGKPDLTGWGTALKPAFEPIVVGRKPLAGTVAANVLAHGTGALNIDGCRTEHASAADLAISLAKNPGRSDLVTSDTYGTGRPQQSVNTAGRWPTNVLLDGSQADELDRQSGTSASRIGKPRGAASGDGWGMTATGAEYDDAGGASRFFPRFTWTDEDLAWQERVDNLPPFRYEAKAPTDERPHVDGVAHPTVKPLDLMRWLVRLVTPPGGTVLEPFAGSGTTVEACLIEGFRCIAIEREAAYLPLITARLSKPIQPDLFGGAA